MRRQDVISSLSYILVAVFAVGFAFVFSMRFIGSVRAQDEVPPATDAPAAVQGSAQSADQETPPADQGTSTPEQSGGFSDLETFLEPFIYDSQNRRDPFMPFAEYQPEVSTIAVQKYDLDQLKLVGIVWDVREPKAMFLDPESTVRVFKRDESIGTHNGYVAAIREGEVVIVEPVSKRGEISYKTKVLRIQR